MRPLLAAVAVLAAGAVAACGGSADASAPSRPREAVVIGGYWPAQPGRRSVRVGVERTACSRDLRITTLVQGPHAVRIAVDARRVQPDRPCPMLVRLECASVALRRPLGRRRLIDARTGRRIGREGLRPPASCPRARRR